MTAAECVDEIEKALLSTGNTRVGDITGRVLSHVRRNRSLTDMREALDKIEDVVEWFRIRGERR